MDMTGAWITYLTVKLKQQYDMENGWMNCC
jgi:hypothetical protein